MVDKSRHSSREASPPSTPVLVHPHPLGAEGSADHVSVGVWSLLHRQTQQSCSTGIRAEGRAFAEVNEACLGEVESHCRVPRGDDRHVACRAGSPYRTI